MVEAPPNNPPPEAGVCEPNAPVPPKEGLAAPAPAPAPEPPPNNPPDGVAEVPDALFWAPNRPEPVLCVPLAGVAPNRPPVAVFGGAGEPKGLLFAAPAPLFANEKPPLPPAPLLLLLPPPKIPVMVELGSGCFCVGRGIHESLCDCWRPRNLTQTVRELLIDALKRIIFVWSLLTRQKNIVIGGSCGNSRPDVSVKRLGI